jgi:enoyl-CoA hydratase
MCDIILASPTAVFGQPEINLGVIPGGGGTQRLARIVGKSRAMELTLTGRNFSAIEAERWGVISRIVEPVEDKQKVVDEAVKMGKLIASKGQISVQAGKEAVNAGELLNVNSASDNG